MCTLKIATVGQFLPPRLRTYRERFQQIHLHTILSMNDMKKYIAQLKKEIEDIEGDIYRMSLTNLSQQDVYQKR